MTPIVIVLSVINSLSIRNITALAYAIFCFDFLKDCSLPLAMSINQEADLMFLRLSGILCFPPSLRSFL